MSCRPHIVHYSAQNLVITRCISRITCTNTAPFKTFIKNIIVNFCLKYFTDEFNSNIYVASHDYNLSDSFILVVQHLKIHSPSPLPKHSLRLHSSKLFT